MPVCVVRITNNNFGQNYVTVELRPDWKIWPLFVDLIQYTDL